MAFTRAVVPSENTAAYLLILSHIYTVLEVEMKRMRG